MLLADKVSRAMKEVIAEFLFVTIFLDGISDASNLSQQFIVLQDVKQNGDARELMICFENINVRTVGLIACIEVAEEGLVLGEDWWLLPFLHMLQFLYSDCRFP